MKTISKIKEINKKFDKKFIFRDSKGSATFSYGTNPINIKSFYSKQILSLIEELEGKKKL